jgi:hypothetical protein
MKEPPDTDPQNPFSLACCAAFLFSACIWLAALIGLAFFIGKLTAT